MSEVTNNNSGINFINLILKEFGVENQEVSNSDVTSIFSMSVDSNNDGKIDKKEFIKAISEYYKQEIDITNLENEFMDAWEDFAGADGASDSLSYSDLSQMNSESSTLLQSSNYNYINNENYQAPQQKSQTTTSVETISLDSLTGKSISELTTERNSILNQINELRIKKDNNEIINNAKNNVEEKKAAYDNALASLENDEIKNENEKSLNNLKNEKTENDTNISNQKSIITGLKDSIYSQNTIINSINSELSGLIEPSENNYKTTNENGEEVIDQEAYNAAKTEYENKKATLEANLLEAENILAQLEENLAEAEMALKTLEENGAKIDQDIQELTQKILEQEANNPAAQAVKEALVEYNNAKENLETIEQEQNANLNADMNQLQENLSTYNNAINTAKQKEELESARKETIEDENGRVIGTNYYDENNQLIGESKYLYKGNSQELRLEETILYDDATGNKSARTQIYHNDDGTTSTYDTRYENGQETSKTLVERDENNQIIGTYKITYDLMNGTEIKTPVNANTGETAEATDATGSQNTITSNGFLDNDKIQQDENGNYYVNAEKWNSSSTNMGSLYGIIRNSYDFEALGVSSKEATEKILDAIVEENNISNPNLIYIGQKIILPDPYTVLGITKEAGNSSVVTNDDNNGTITEEYSPGGIKESETIRDQDGRITKQTYYDENGKITGDTQYLYRGNSQEVAYQENTQYDVETGNKTSRTQIYYREDGTTLTYDTTYENDVQTSKTLVERDKDNNIIGEYIITEDPINGGEIRTPINNEPTTPPEGEIDNSIYQITDENALAYIETLNEIENNIKELQENGMESFASQEYNRISTEVLPTVLEDANISVRDKVEILKQIANIDPHIMTTFLSVREHYNSSDAYMPFIDMMNDCTSIEEAQALSDAFTTFYNYECNFGDYMTNASMINKNSEEAKLYMNSLASLYKMADSPEEIQILNDKFNTSEFMTKYIDKNEKAEYLNTIMENLNTIELSESNIELSEWQINAYNSVYRDSESILDAVDRGYLDSNIGLNLIIRMHNGDINSITQDISKQDKYLNVFFNMLGNDYSQEKTDDENSPTTITGVSASTATKYTNELSQTIEKVNWYNENGIYPQEYYDLIDSQVEIINNLLNDQDVDFSDKIKTLENLSENNNDILYSYFVTNSHPYDTMENIINILGQCQNADQAMEFSELFAQIYDNSEVSFATYLQSISYQIETDDSIRILDNIVSLYENASPEDITKLNNIFDTANSIQSLLSFSNETNMLEKLMQNLLNNDNTPKIESSSLGLSDAVIKYLPQQYPSIKSIFDAYSSSSASDKIDEKTVMYLMQQMDATTIVNSFRSMSNSKQQEYLPLMLNIFGEDFSA